MNFHPRYTITLHEKFVCGPDPWLGCRGTYVGAVLRLPLPSNRLWTD